jgi:hypothetical protein
MSEEKRKPMTMLEVAEEQLALMEHWHGVAQWVLETLERKRMEEWLKGPWWNSIDEFLKIQERRRGE